MREGIAVGGTVLVDVLKTVSAFPKEQELVKILDIDRACGGAVCNVLGDLARLDGDIPLWAVGRIGKDSEGEYILNELGRFANIDTTRMKIEGRTSFTDVMVDAASRRRTFFTYPGASAQLDVADFDLKKLNCKVLLAAYILLLDTLDAPDAEYGTRMARLLHDAQAEGILTCVDVVSESGNRYCRLVPPALKYTDYLIVNELEAGKTCNIPLRTDDGKLIPENIPAALHALRDMGVRKWIVIHAPEGSWGLDENGECVARPSLLLPEGFIKGTVGAGDAFCAGVLLAACKGESMASAMDDGACAAAASLRAPGASEGVDTLDKVRALANELGWRK